MADPEISKVMKGSITSDRGTAAPGNRGRGWGYPLIEAADSCQIQYFEQHADLQYSFFNSNDFFS